MTSIFYFLTHRSFPILGGRSPKGIPAGAYWIKMKPIGGGFDFFDFYDFYKPFRPKNTKKWILGWKRSVKKIKKIGRCDYMEDHTKMVWTRNWFGPWFGPLVILSIFRKCMENGHFRDLRYAVSWQRIELFWFRKKRLVCFTVLFHISSTWLFDSAPLHHRQHAISDCLALYVVDIDTHGFLPPYLRGT